MKPPLLSVLQKVFQGKKIFISKSRDKKKGHCPNCGKETGDDLLHSSVRRVDIKGIGMYASTLYGVCYECAKAHANENL